MAVQGKRKKYEAKRYGYNEYGTNAKQKVLVEDIKLKEGSW